MKNEMLKLLGKYFLFFVILLKRFWKFIDATNGPNVLP
jgi:hypothetical protein